MLDRISGMLHDWISTRKFWITGYTLLACIGIHIAILRLASPPDPLGRIGRPKPKPKPVPPKIQVVEVAKFIDKREAAVQTAVEKTVHSLDVQVV